MDYKTIYEYYWMRPENAVWRARDFEVMKDIHLTRPILDFGAGDGAVSFLRAGGQLSPHYDAFSETMDTTKFFGGEDIYDQFNDLGEDIVIRDAEYKIDVAFDLKTNLLAKAKKLNFYEKIVIGDGNQPLPFADNEFRTVFSNIVYWLTDPLRVLEELVRVTMSNGQIVILVPSNCLAEYSFYNKYYLEQGKPETRKFLELLDLGRLASNIKISKSAADWESIFAQCGLEVAVKRNYISGVLVRLWDVGLRPFSPFMIQMANSLGRNERAVIKQRWVDETYELFKGFLNIQGELEEHEPPAFFLFVLNKN